MDVDEWYVVEFVAGPDEAAITSESDNLPKSQPKPIYVSSVMRVNLLPDPAFMIEPKVAALQNTGPDRTASWQWDVKPKTDGKHRLIARVEVLKPASQGKYEILDQYTRRVGVTVRVGTWTGFLNALQNASSLGDALATLFRSWEKTLLALAALILAGYVVWRAIHGKG
jgi:hypothetical protein